MLIVFAGLPGTGKTTLARELAQRISAVYVRIDSIENAILHSNLEFPPENNAGYLVGYVIAEDNLRLGKSVVADAVNDTADARNAWRDIAIQSEQKCVEIEVVCSAAGEHQRRIEQRSADLPGHELPTWKNVLDRRYAPWNRDRFVIDTASRTPIDCVSEIQRYLDGLGTA